MNVVPLGVVARAELPADLPGKLRELAQLVEDGTVTEMVVGYVIDGAYEFLWPSTLHQSVVITAMLHQTAVDNMRR